MFRLRLAAAGAAARRRLSTEATPSSSPSITSVPPNRVPFKSRAAWFSVGLNFTLILALYQLGQDASEAAGKLDLELKKIRDDTALIQKGLRAKIAKLEADIGKLQAAAATAPAPAVAASNTSSKSAE